MVEGKWRQLLIFPLALIFLISVGMVIRQQRLYRDIASDSTEAAKVAGLPEQSLPSGTTVLSYEELAAAPEQGEPSEPLPEDVIALTDIDLAALRVVNEDVVGWIEIPGTELSYPLMQGTDNQFYLSHNWKGEASGGGSVFLESSNSLDLTDFHTIVYAHRMRNDSMFGTLKYYEDLDFWQEHPIVYLMVDTGVYRYDIFAAQEADVQGVVYRLDLTESCLEDEFLQCCLNGSVIDTGIIPTDEDQILTLSTCTGNGHAKRWVVHGMLARVYEILKTNPPN